MPPNTFDKPDDLPTKTPTARQPDKPAITDRQPAVEHHRSRQPPTRRWASGPSRGRPREKAFPGFRRGTDRRPDEGAVRLTS